MNYVYDILLNFNEYLYDFYDWNLNDNIYHIRRIPLCKVDTKTLLDLKQTVVQVTDDFLKRIDQKIEVFEKHKVGKIRYACVFSDGLESLALVFDEQGISKKGSTLLLEEETEVNELCLRIDEEQLSIKKLLPRINHDSKTRLEVEKEQFILREIKELEEKQKHDKLKYLFYDCFNQKEENISNIIEKIKLTLKDNNSMIRDQLYDLLKLTLYQK